MDMKFEWNEPVVSIVAKKTGGRQGQLFLANEAARLMDPYVPARNLVLAQNIRITADEDHGTITYNSLYAHYQYAGVLYVDPQTKKGAFTDGKGRFWSRPNTAKIPSAGKLEYSKFRHPLATSHWDQAMKVAHMRELEKSMQKYIEEQDK